MHFIVRIMGDSFQFQLPPHLDFSSALDLRVSNEKNFSPKSCTFAPCTPPPPSFLLSVAKVFLQLRKTLIPGHHPLAERNLCPPLLLRLHLALALQTLPCSLVVVAGYVGTALNVARTSPAPAPEFR